MQKSHWIVSTALAVTYCFVLSCKNTPPPETIVFAEKLSSYGLYTGPMGNLHPSHGVEVYELASPLFTDYADKQRLLLLPEGHQMVARDAGLPDFPEGTILAKSFYYDKYISGETTVRKVVETRILLKHEGIWNAATYRWNDTQDEAILLTTGAEFPLSFVDPRGKEQHINYQIPTKLDCQSCHKQGDAMLPIGPKVRTINVTVDRGGEAINQLEYLKQRGKLEAMATHFPSTPDYNDIHLNLEQRARAYLDLNCAHCHNPRGDASYMGLDVALETPLAETNILKKASKIFSRMTLTGELHMPKIGTTTHHEEGIALIKAYLVQLSSK